MRREYMMTDEQLTALLEASRPTPVMFVSGGIPIGASQQENANRAWQRLGDDLGFDHTTVQPVAGASMHCFTAEPRAATEEVDDEH